MIVNQTKSSRMKLAMLAGTLFALLQVAPAVAQEATTFGDAEINAVATTAVDPLNYSGPAWSPYVVGALIGVLSMFTFYFSNKALGASSAYAKITGVVAEQFSPQHVKSLKYFQDNPPKIDWGVMLVVGVIIGAFVGAWSGGELTGQFLPDMWQDRFGSESYGLRAIVALCGGILMAFGARTAGGCTSGHGISGALQLSIGSWIAAICFFIGGIFAAMMIYG